MKFLLFLSLTLLFISCNKDEDIAPIPPTTQQGQQTAIEVYTYQCETIRCKTEIPKVGIIIELFSSEEDAISDNNRLRATTTNAEGKAIFSNINQDLVYIKIETEEYGTYIDSERINANTVRVFHDVRFINGYTDNDNNESQLIQRHISLSNPAVGQQSTYKYHVSENHISFKPLNYTDVELNVRIVDQLDSNTFVIREEIDSLIGPLGNPFYPDDKTVTSLWRIENNSLHITPYENNIFGSFAWNLNGSWHPAEENGYTFSLDRPIINGIDMNSDEVFSLDWWGTGFAANYILFEHEYDQLITDLISYQATDGPVKFRAYNLDDGLVRSLDFWNGSAPTTHGFDLVLE